MRALCVEEPRLGCISSDYNLIDNLLQTREVADTHMRQRKWTQSDSHTGLRRKSNRRIPIMKTTVSSLISNVCSYKQVLHSLSSRRVSMIVLNAVVQSTNRF